MGMGMRRIGWTAGLTVAAGGSVASLRHARSEGTAVDDKDWRRIPSRGEVFQKKLLSLVSLHTVSARPPLPDWEGPIAEDPNLHMHPRVSRLATSASSDGLILKDTPRIYAPFVPFTDEDMSAEDHKERLSKRGVKCVWHFGDDGVGHPLTVHGGCIAMAMDESFGHAYMSLGRGPGYTAFIHINYRVPLPTGDPTLIDIEFEKLEGRKVFMKGKLTDGKGKVFSDATCLFVQPRPKADVMEQAQAQADSGGKSDAKA